MIKKIIWGISILMITFILCPTAYAGNINILINGNYVQFTDSSGHPFIDSNNRTQVPLRVTMEAYGCTVGWNQITRTATVVKDGTTVDVPIGKPYIIVNGVIKANDTVSQIVNNRTFLPIRAVLEAVGAQVEWDPTTYTVKVTGAGVSRQNVSDIDIKLLKKNNKYFYITSDRVFVHKSNNKFYSSANLNLLNNLYNLFSGKYTIDQDTSGNPNIAGSISAGKAENVVTRYWNEYDGATITRMNTQTITFQNGNKISVTGDSNRAHSCDPTDIVTTVNSAVGSFLILDLERCLEIAGIDKAVNIYYDNYMKCYVLDVD